MRRLLPRVGPRALMIRGLALATGAAVWLSRLDASASWLTAVLPAEVVMSVGLGLVFVPLFTVGLDGVDEGDTGVVSGALDATQQVGGAIGVALLNAVFAAAIATDGPAATATSLAATLDGYRLAFLVAAGVFALALAVVIAFVRPSTSEASEPTTAAGG